MPNPITTSEEAWKAAHTLAERTVGRRPSYEEVKPLACGEDEPFYYTIYERFVDLNDMRPLTTWGESSYA